MILRSDCKYFPGDRPCSFNKREGMKCDVCPYYETEQTRILIIKLEAVGDVLRTTCILHGLKERYPKNEITWITAASAVPLFDNNNFVDRVFVYSSTETILHILAEEFDLVINLDSAPNSAVLASTAKSKEKFGYGMDARGNIYPFNAEAIPWLEMGAFDDVKKKNMRSFQDIMLDICRLKPSRKDIILELSTEELQFAHSFAERAGLGQHTKKIGLNTGASGRWQLKQWTMEGYETLIKLLVEQTTATILLYGGPLEKERNERLAGLYPSRVVHTGTNNSLRQFFALVTLCDIFLTGDTLALHVATALKKKTIALFGPTSAAEIDDYDGQIIKVQADLDCLVCYKPRCDFNPNCMNSITPERLFSIIQKEVTF
jgi:ADP-heptose:LPS heptosyltransferase